jgi:uncharacterized protein YkwD
VGGRAGAAAVALVAGAACAASASGYPGHAVAAKLAAKRAHGAAVARRSERALGALRGPAFRTPAAASSPRTQARPALSAVDRAMLVEINAVRTRHGLRAVVPSRGLMNAARRHSLEMVRNGYFSHSSADGSSFESRVRRYYRGLRSAGENIAFGCPELSAAEAMSLWMNSPGHRRNILDPRWREIGISVVHVESAPGPDYRGDPTTVATTDFGRR